MVPSLPHGCCVTTHLLIGEGLVPRGSPHPSANDVRALAPGVYFVQQEGSSGLGVEDSRVTKIVVTH